MLIGILSLLIRELIETRLKTLVFLIVATISFILSEFAVIYNFFQFGDNIAELEGTTLIGPLFSLVAIFFAILISYHMIILFLESAESVTIRSRHTLMQNIILGILATGFLIFTTLASLSIIDVTNGVFSFEESSSLLIGGVWIGWILFILLSFLYSLYMIIKIYRMISERQKASTADQRSKVLMQLKITVIIIFIGSILPLIFFGENNHLIQNLSSFISTLGFTLFVVIYLKNGVYILGNLSLRRLIMINDSGTSIFGYVFQSFQDSKMTDGYEQEILFSGAIQAITSLLNELTGANDDLISLDLESTSILFERLSDHNSVLLVVDEPTAADREALKAFKVQINRELDKIPEQRIDKTQTNTITRITEQLFGPGVTSK